MKAYPQGIFPWFEREGLYFWYFTEPRMIVRPNHVYISKSMKKVMRERHFEITSNKAFEQVVRKCAEVERKGEQSTWISDRFLEVYHDLFKAGVAISYESWKNDQLVGGLYGLKIGSVYFGESMFSVQSNASKACFIKLCGDLEEQGVQLIDCQVESDHMRSLGGETMSKETFYSLLQSLV